MTSDLGKRILMKLGKSKTRWCITNLDLIAGLKQSYRLFLLTKSAVSVLNKRREFQEALKIH